MSGVNPVSGGMSSQEINQLSTQLNGEASRARNLIDGFSAANDIISNPHRPGLSTSEMLRENYRFNLQVVSGALGDELAKGSKVDLWV